MPRPLVTLFARVASTAAGLGEYSESQQMTVFADRPVVSIPAGAARTQTRTAPDPQDPYIRVSLGGNRPHRLQESGGSEGSSRPYLAKRVRRVVGNDLDGNYSEAAQMTMDGQGFPVISGPLAQLRTLTKKQWDPQD